MKPLFVPIFLCLAILTGCSGINPKTLSGYSTSKSLVIDSDISYTGKRGLYPFQEGLRKGVYRAELKDENGVYFRGPGLCAYTTPSHDGKTREYEGGLWVPNNGDLTHSRIYSYFSAARFFAEEKTVTGVTLVKPGGKETTIPGILTLPIYLDDGNLYVWDKEVGNEFSGNINWRDQQ
jgi:hypothetical protein